MDYKISIQLENCYSQLFTFATMNFYLLPRLQLIVGLTCRKDEQFCYQKFRAIFPLTFFGPQDIRRRSAHTSIVPNFLWATAFSFRRRIRTRQQWIQESSKNYSYSRSPTSRWNCSSMLFQLMGYSIHGMQWRRWGTSQYIYRAFILLTMTMNFQVLRPHFHPSTGVAHTGQE